MQGLVDGKFAFDRVTRLGVWVVLWVRDHCMINLNEGHNKTVVLDSRLIWFRQVSVISMAQMRES